LRFPIIIGFAMLILGMALTRIVVGMPIYLGYRGVKYAPFTLIRRVLIKRKGL